MDGERLGPRLVIAGTHSGVGKTTVATGLLRALRRAGHRPAGAKVGPDFIDPGYHALACGRPPRNLDAWICGPEAVAPLAGRASAGADVLVVEGVMGLFDGAFDGAPASTADVARLIGAPVVLVVDAAAMSGSVAALVHGFATFDPSVPIAGLILNRVGSDSHEAMLRHALTPLAIPVLGVLRRDPAFTWRDRHLGLVPVAERPAETGAALDRLAAAVAGGVDLAAVMAVAGLARPTPVPPVPVPIPYPNPQPRPKPAPAGPRVAVAAGNAFTFTYTDTLEALAAAGAEVVPFDPRFDPALPDSVDGLFAGGGFPEVFADDMAANQRLLDDVRRRITAGLPTWAECGGLLWLCRQLGDRTMAGVVAADAHMTGRLTLGYRSAIATAPNPVVDTGDRLRGHEFHYSTVEPAGEALELSGRDGTRPEGWSSPTLLATYLHHHPGGDPGPIGRFAAHCARYADSRQSRQSPQPRPVGR